MGSFFAFMFLSAIGYAITGVKIVNQGNIALVERLGRYERTLGPGLNWTAPGFDQIVWEDTTREQFFAITRYKAITNDNVSLDVDLKVRWKIENLRDTYYEVDDVVTAIESSIRTNLGSELSKRDLEEILETRVELMQLILKSLQSKTVNWGVKVIEIDITDIIPPEDVLDSMEKERAAEIQKRADLLEADATAQYMSRIAEAIETRPYGREILHFFATQRYVDASFKMGESENSKVVFLDPKALSENLTQIMGSQLAPPELEMTHTHKTIVTPPPNTAPPTSVPVEQSNSDANDPITEMPDVDKAAG
ncbi:MAG: SPFH/Band 7/PHB domain protein [Coleofasciculaceae cyanobacterium RL_1_1]|nr:SPFH/Band 7/PHB domain protein [Coleofasciculaceae cyanobacterium RL_1_1]